MTDQARASTLQRVQGRLQPYRTAADAFASLPIPVIREPKGK